ncbi:MULTISPECIES: bacterioferritin [Deefgea]|uniref:Bacterioferritin n=1 Tax=Deefgea chitinilytica TaxID=570276 RepID=A0ABS2C7T2_9NEIS|nr:MULTISPECIES: bacterioferritin [Deefgea]MBM5570224.1 bacterioferritin [Deefgea chitinilytica]MBM9887453.1 bacterioferritin [Deefgea sp. CFH1-16]
MKGSPKVIAALSELLAAELTSVDQYFVHSQMYHNWGYDKLFERIDHERQDEIGHATLLIKRILFLEGIPNVAARTPLRIGSNVPEMLQFDLLTEYEVAAALKKTIALCEKEQDYVTRDMLMTLLEDTEQDHAHWLEQQLFLIKQITLENYLQSQAF